MYDFKRMEIRIESRRWMKFTKGRGNDVHAQIQKGVETTPVHVNIKQENYL
jgi:hypothetical protein